jgi:hypothetical protein
MDCVGIEKEAEYVKTARLRMKAWDKKVPEVTLKNLPGTCPGCRMVPSACMCKEPEGLQTENLFV